MQEEVTQKTIALSVKTARVTADVLKNMLRKYLSGQKQKGKNPYKVGKQSYKELKSQGSGLSNIEITDGNIKSFERVAKKYRLDFALKKDSSTKPPTYYVFFKGQDTEMMNLAFKKYLGVQMNKKDKPSIMKKLMHFKDAVSKGKNLFTTRLQRTARAGQPVQDTARLAPSAARKNSSIRRKEEKFSISEALRKREKYLEKLFFPQRVSQEKCLQM